MVCIQKNMLRSSGTALMLLALLSASCAGHRSTQPLTPESALPASVAILPFQNTTPQGGIEQELRTAFYTAFSSKKYIDVELTAIESDLAGLKAVSTDELYKMPPAELGLMLGCDGLVYGKATDFRKIYAGIYSQFGIEAEVWMVDVKTGKEVCRVRDAVRYHGWMLPTSILGALVTGAETALNLREIQQVRLLHELCYKLAGQMPEPQTCAAAAPEPVRENAAAAVPAAQTLPPKLSHDNTTASAPTEPAARDGAAELSEAGYRSFARGDYGTAAVLLEKAVKSGPNPQDFCILSVCLRQINDSERALAFLKEGVGLYPRDSALWKALGLLLYERDEHAGAKAAFQEVLRLKPGDETTGMLLSRLPL